MKNFKNIRLLAGGLVGCLLGGLLGGCEREYDDPARFQPVEMTPTMTIAQLKSLYTSSSLEIADDIVIAGRVISTDRNGNFYRSFYMEDETSGMEIKIGKTGLYNYYPEGMTVYVKAKGLCLGAYGGMVSLGAPPSEADQASNYQNTWIDVQYWIDQTVFRGKRGEPVTPKVITAMSQITPDLYGTLVRLENMTFQGGTLDTWAVSDDTATDENEAAYGEQRLQFSGGSGTVVIRTSGYARFADSKVPAKGSIVNVTAVLTKYNSTTQLVLNSAEDVEVVSAP
ncbi:DUF5689 domain-containing protein [Gallalistipes aquisgranensis]|uniref:DUF5689 domain-containing protein n=1 Tax=Gallalistipes aquisgranensis TaxID=2779358 RepID=UPI001CF8C40A|nr:DUF5689 domain-containing protein [Gallalistipes aquisgranensis]MBE5033335.1 OB-fold nucleic acid binding domain-containing protein [Gallalistipes aquisgranensis]